jgi:hypothetical protein
VTDVFDKIIENENSRTECPLCDFCVKHKMHSGYGHNYDFDACWKCVRERDNGGTQPKK